MHSYTNLINQIQDKKVMEPKAVEGKPSIITFFAFNERALFLHILLLNSSVPSSFTFTTCVSASLLLPLTLFLYVK